MVYICKLYQLISLSILILKYLPGLQIITGSFDRTVKTWDLQTGKCLTTYNNLGPVTSVTVGDNDRFLVSSLDEPSQVYDTILNNLSKINSGKDVSTVIISKCGYLAAIGQKNGNIELFNLIAKFKLKSQKPHNDIIKSIAISEDLKIIATGGIDKKTILYDNLSDRIIAEVEHSTPVSAVAISPNGKFIVSVSLDGNGIVFDSNGQEHMLLTSNIESDDKNHNTGVYMSPITSVAINDSYVLTGCLDGTARLQNYVSKRLERVIQTGSSVTSLTLNNEIAVVCNLDYVAKIQDIKSGEMVTEIGGKEIYDGHKNMISSVAFKPQLRK